jgi:release factor glutamine methyltransferase
LWGLFFFHYFISILIYIFGAFAVRLNRMQNFKDGVVPLNDNRLSSLYKMAQTALSGIYEADELENIVLWLVEHYTGVVKTSWLQNPHQHINQSNLIHFCNAVEELKKGTPVQYVIGVVEFYGLNLEVNPAVLIPRPETEELVDLIVKEHAGDVHLNILEIGTGSGCIALSLARHLNGSKVTAVDVSTEALAVATFNAHQNHITEVKFLALDILQKNEWKENEFHLMVSNPPYIAKSEATTMLKNVLDFEPAQALFVPNEDPLIFYRKIAELGKTCLKSGGQIYVEINENLGEETVALFTTEVYSSVHLLKDMFGKNRFIKAIKI